MHLKKKTNKQTSLSKLVSGLGICNNNIYNISYCYNNIMPPRSDKLPLFI